MISAVENESRSWRMLRRIREVRILRFTAHASALLHPDVKRTFHAYYHNTDGQTRAGTGISFFSFFPAIRLAIAGKAPAGHWRSAFFLIRPPGDLSFYSGLIRPFPVISSLFVSDISYCIQAGSH